MPTDDLISKTKCGRNQHSVAIQTAIANTDVYKGNFFPPDYQGLECPSRFSSAEDAEDCVAIFTSLVRARE